METVKREKKEKKPIFLIRIMYIEYTELSIYTCQWDPQYNKKTEITK